MAPPIAIPDMVLTAPKRLNTYLRVMEELDNKKRVEVLSVYKLLDNAHGLPHGQAAHKGLVPAGISVVI